MLGWLGKIEAKADRPASPTKALSTSRFPHLAAKIEEPGLKDYEQALSAIASAEWRLVEAAQFA